MNRTERIRQEYKENPNLSHDEVAKKLHTSRNIVSATVSKDVKAGRCIRGKDGSLDYSEYFKNQGELVDLREWKNEVRRELIDQLLEANRHEIASDQIRLNAKVINKLLEEVGR